VTRRQTTAAVSGLIVVLGLILLAETAIVGGGAAGYLLGVLFIVAGAGRLYLSMR
jgi:uncharacterized membrane protein HdeD (DUF308 family)